MIKELILNQTVTANMVLIITGGLPFSGKSTLINKLVNASGRWMQTVHLFVMFVLFVRWLCFILLFCNATAS